MGIADMIQEIFIDTDRVRYSIAEKHVIAVLGSVYIYKVPTFDNLLEIVFRGLTDQKGLTFEEFRYMYYTGIVRTSKKKGQYTFFMVRQLVMARVKEINRKAKLQMT